MRIGILGTGNIAAALGARWVAAGHEVAIGGRSAAKARALAERLGGTSRAVSPREAVTGRDAVLLAVTWDGVADTLASVGAADGTLAGIPLIDPANPVAHGGGRVLTDRSNAEYAARLAPGAHVVKAFHLFPAAQWTMPDAAPVTVATCGDDPAALTVVGGLVRDAGGTPAVLGGLDRARQLEEVAGFVIGLIFAGIDPGSAIPSLPAASA